MVSFCRLNGLITIVMVFALQIGSVDLTWAEEWESDARFPHEHEGEIFSMKTPFYRIGSDLEQVQNLIRQKKEALATLAPLDVEKQFDGFGYHSDFIPVVNGVPKEPLWSLDFRGKNTKTEAIVLLPAFDQRTPELKGYAFPKRFRIRSMTSGGEPGPIYVDWTNKDFPDPGMRPVYFAFPRGERVIGDLRLEVFAGEEKGDLEYFALGRVYPIRWKEAQSVAVRSVSSSYESEPYWSRRYLNYSRQFLGNPLSSDKGEADDFLAELPSSRLKKPIVVRIDLREADLLGWVNIFPSQSKDGIGVPGYGLPHSMQLFRIYQNGKGALKRVALTKKFDPRTRTLGKNLFRIAGKAQPVEAIEIVCNDFPVYQDQAIFSMGEIQIFKASRNLSKDAKVSISILGNWSSSSDLNNLVDNKVGGRNIIQLEQWLRELAEGKSYEDDLKQMMIVRDELIARQQAIRERSLWALGSCLFATVCFNGVFLVRNRRKTAASLRKQIYSDLHDEVGSKLGSIALLSEHLKGVARSEWMKVGMADLTLMTREAYSSLREVVWLADQKTVRLPVLIQKLSERAGRVLSDMDFYSEVPADCPDLLVSLPIKRHLMMFFNELLHNCARHSKASEALFNVDVDESHLTIELVDDGRGFDPSQQSDGWGVPSMQQRALEMGAEMMLSSKLGEGTSISLKLSLGALASEPSDAYKTSN